MKALDFPLMYAMMFITEILQKLKIDFRPNNNPDPLKYRYTGDSLRDSYLNAGYKGKILKVKMTRYDDSGPFNKVYCSEYYLNGIKDIFACHFGRGSSFGRAKYLKGPRRFIYFTPIIGDSLSKIKGKREIKKWLKICRNIVDTFKLK